MSASLSLTTPYNTQTLYFGAHPDYESLLADYDKVLVISDKRLHNVAIIEKLQQRIMQAHPDCSEYEVEINNYSKNTELLTRLIGAMSDAGLTRRSLLISVGGGSTADLVGVAASVYMRGIDYGVIATSYISMVDGIISKVAVNHESSKNLIGAFYSPRWSLIDVGLRDRTNKMATAHGLVEVWKHALLEQADDMKARIAKALDEQTTSEDELLAISEWSMRTKTKYVLDDWTDTQGLHKGLSLGHTLANYFEMNAIVHHAEAVLGGIIFEAFVAHDLNYIPDTRLEEILDMADKFDQVFGSLSSIQSLMNANKMMNSLQRDKISENNEIKLVLPAEKGYVVEAVTSKNIIRAIDRFRKLKQAHKINNVKPVVTYR